MRRPRIFLYRWAKKPKEHDRYEYLRDVIPFSRAGIHDHFEVVKSPEAADVCYMGQVGDRHVRTMRWRRFRYLKRYPQKHVLDVEGDWPGWEGSELPEKRRIFREPDRAHE